MTTNTTTATATKYRTGRFANFDQYFASGFYRINLRQRFRGLHAQKEVSSLGTGETGR